MSPTRKAAILLLSLDQSMASQVLGHLSREEVEAATLAIAEMGHVTLDEQNAVLTEFKSQFHSSPKIRRGGPETARELLEQVLGDDAEPVQESIEPTVEAGSFAFLNHHPVEDIQVLLADESSQVIAVVVAQLAPALSNAIIAGFEPDRQADILQRIARLGATDEAILDEIANILRSRLTRSRVRKGGMPHAVSVLREGTRESNRSILKSLENRGASIAHELRQSLFTFDDVLKLDDATLRIVLEETNHRHWALALKASNETIRQKVFSCLSSHVAQALKREMQTLGPVRLSEMTVVRQQISEDIHRLDQTGVIELPV